MIVNDTMNTLPIELYRAEQVRELDSIAIEQRGIPGFQLMSRAGLAAFQKLQQHWPEADSLAVFCGAGNNAGDGYIVARLALESGMLVTVYAVSPAEKLHGDARLAMHNYQQIGGEIIPYERGMACKAELIVDALLGTGLDRPVTGIYAQAIETINGLDRPVVALDIPSGLHADTGSVLGCAVHASCTISFIGLKRGLFTDEAADYCGKIHFSSLDVPQDIYSGMPVAAWRLTEPHLPRRRRCEHKGSNGHVLIIGGEQGYSGAARMAAEAAARVGAGLVSIATRAAHAALMNGCRPELMCHGVETTRQLRPLLDRATVIVVGPGLGQSQWAGDLLHAAMESGKPLLVDADALNLLANTTFSNARWVLTPHPGEAARLLDCSVRDVQKDRFAAAEALQQRYSGCVVLKGAGTLIVDASATYVCGTGNPGMASGGMGDVLSGVIGGLMAQRLAVIEAVKSGVHVHGAAADSAAEQGERGMLAGDLLPHLRRLVNVR